MNIIDIAITVFILATAAYATHCQFTLRKHIIPEKMTTYEGDYKPRLGRIPPPGLLDAVGLKKLTHFRVSGVSVLLGVFIQYFLMR